MSNQTNAGVDPANQRANNAGPPHAPPSTHGATAMGSLALAALGIVFGDLGTSPLYALQEAFNGARGVAATPENVVGIVSLFLWSLILMVSIKYVLVLMQADNHGEGGLLALLALLVGERTGREMRRGALRWVFLAMFGTAMLYGDGVITPAISVLSAVEGIEVATPAFSHYVVPITVVILVALFAVQPLGSGRVGVAFGPILAIWFVVIFVLGVASVATTPTILAAFNPANGFTFFLHNGFRGFLALGAVVLCLTGGEALYADMGHFGARPIRLAWYGLALPALTASYLGQGALLLRDPGAASRPFYTTVPAWGLYPMVVLATLATIVASQALISAVFSLTRQAAQLGLSPRVTVRHTSSSTAGQIYLPGLNWLLMVGTIGVVLLFRSSDRLAAAFGIAVSTTMAITTMLFAAFAHVRLKWPMWRIALVAGIFMIVDASFVAANALKFADGGWLPLAVGSLTFLVSTSWLIGLRAMRRSRGDSGLPLKTFISSLAKDAPYRVTGTAVFLMAAGDSVPTTLLHHLKHNQVLHQRVVLLTLLTEEIPRVPQQARFDVECFDQGFIRVVGRYGYLESLNVPDLLEQALQKAGRETYDAMTTSFYLGRESLTVRPDLNIGRRLLLSLFILLRKNELDATAHLKVPPNRVVEMGARLDLV
ncbi:MAG TPA: KUP/HAK/KT family potassium transporter [Paraburkholderia sp.]|uniref:potassium transporter Kup n=1 Tax=Paraburkholderia sp. TaxID=1926495 RepID=UPI002B5D1840|nr:KUP/HAK/KT family potassium transporter [Paraburkholderia sp.]HTR10178.1 KUP/HAK/KT family potassium transporter [Paraburkholderia sp.]